MKRKFEILEKLATPEAVTPSITATKGEVTSVAGRKVGSTMTLTFSAKNTNATPAGSNIFEGNLENYRPKFLVNGVGYIGQCAGVLQLLGDGTVTIRATGGNIAANAAIYISVKYVLA